MSTENSEDQIPLKNAEENFNLNIMKYEKNYKCTNIKIPKIEDMDKFLEVIDLTDSDLIEEILEIQILELRLKNIMNTTGLSREEIIENGITLASLIVESKEKGEIVKISHEGEENEIVW